MNTKESKYHTEPVKPIDGGTVFKLDIQRQFEEQKKLNVNLQGELAGLRNTVKIAQNEFVHGLNAINKMESMTSVEKFRPGIHEPVLFWDRIILYGGYKEWDNAKTLQMFPFFISDSEFQWFRQLAGGEKDTLAHLKASFLKKFSDKEENQWIVFKRLAERVQKPGEKVKDYMEDVLYLCRQVGEENDHQQRKIMAGLLPEIRKFVVGQRPTTLDEIERYAKIAEGLETPEEVSKLEMLNTMIEKMKMEQSHDEVSGVQRERGRSRERRVTFQENANGIYSQGRSDSRERYNYYQRPQYENRGRGDNYGQQRNANRGRSYNYGPQIYGSREQADDYQQQNRNRERQGPSGSRSQSPRYNRARSNSERNNANQFQQAKCSRCGKYNCLPYSCQAKNARCFYCKNNGHFERCCRKKQTFLSQTGTCRRN